MVYFGGNYTAQVQGSITKQARCEHCGSKFVYDVWALGSGSGKSAYFLDNQGAKNRSSERAHSDVVTKLESAAELARCPSCNKFQKNGVTLLRKTLAKTITRWIYIPLIISALISL